MGLYIEETVDIYEYPSKIAILEKGSKIQFGDLHANAVKMLYFLVREGIWNVTREQYAKFVELYKTPVKDITPQLLQDFIQLIAKFTVNEPSPEICFIGDDFADRGNNDEFIEEMYKQLSLQNVSFEVLNSNHSAQFLKQYAYGLNKENVTIYTGNHSSFGLSLHSLQALLADNRVNIDDINAFVRQHYLSKYKLLSYRVEDENSLTIFSHAPIDESALNLIASYFGLTIPETATEIAKTIDKMNQIFQLLCDAPIDHNKLDKLKQLADLLGVTYQDENKDAITKTINKIYKHFKYSIDIRDDDFLQKICSISAMEKLTNDRYSDLAKRSYMKTTILCNIKNIHGHVCFEELPESLNKKWQYINLDSMLGLTFMNNENNVGVYKVCTDNTGYCPAAKPVVNENTIVVKLSEMNLFSADKKTDEQPLQSSLSIRMTDII